MDLSSLWVAQPFLAVLASLWGLCSAGRVARRENTGTNLGALRSVLEGGDFDSAVSASTPESTTILHSKLVPLSYLLTKYK
ncbi:MAG: hypothetical protein NVS9B4_09690 [Candidatus Acidiferrum sp.]